MPIMYNYILLLPMLLLTVKYHLLIILNWFLVEGLKYLLIKLSSAQLIVFRVSSSCTIF